MPRDGTQRIYGWMETLCRESNGTVSWRNGNAQRIALRHCRRCGVTPPTGYLNLAHVLSMGMKPPDNEGATAALESLVSVNPSYQGGRGP